MFGIDILDAAMFPALLIAFLAGVISFLSPCVLPIVPPYLAYISGISLTEVREKDNPKSVFLPAVFFVMGLSTVFLILGFTASALGTIFLFYQKSFNLIAGLVIMLFGLHFLKIIRIGFLDREIRFGASSQDGSAFGAYVLGLAFAFGWTPCIGPQLASILTLAASEGSVSQGTFLLGIYALGLGLPFLIVALFLKRLSGTITWLKTRMEVIESTMGLLLWTIGLLILTGGFENFSFWILNNFPALANVG